MPREIWIWELLENGRKRDNNSRMMRRNVYIGLILIILPEQMAMIDWNDFVIVETIDFFEEERAEKVIEKEVQRFDRFYGSLDPTLNFMGT